VDHCQGLMVAVNVICSSMGRGYRFTVVVGGKEMKPDIVYLLNVFMFAV